MKIKTTWYWKDVQQAAPKLSKSQCQDLIKKYGLYLEDCADQCICDEIKYLIDKVDF